MRDRNLRSGNGFCPSGVADECGTIQLVGLGVADWAYDFGPTFEPNGRCFDVDGTLTITLQSDGSTISGPLTGLFCLLASATGQQHGGAVSYGNPFVEDDVVMFANGTGQFSGLSGTASFHTFFAGAALRGTLQGTPQRLTVLGGGGHTTAPTTFGSRVSQGQTAGQNAGVSHQASSCSSRRRERRGRAA